MKFRALFAVLAASTALALTACSSPGTAGGPAAAGGSSGATSSAPAAAGQAKHGSVCAALPAAAAAQITGTKFTTAKASSVEGVVFSCEYDGPDSALLQISVDIQDGSQAFTTDVTALKTVGHPPVLISGVGDKAFSEPDPKGNAGSVGASAFASYGAVFGQTYIKIGGLTYVTADQGKQIAERLHSQF